MKKIIFNINNLIILFIIVVIFHNFKSAKNIYTITKYKYETRLSNSYDYCGNESVGFLSHIKDKYKIDGNIQINNYFVSPYPSWFFKLTYNKIINDKIILLGYVENYEINFYKSDNYFMSKQPIKVLNNIQNISFDTNKENNNKKIKFNIYQELFGEKKLIYESNLISLDDKNQSMNLNLSLKNTLNNAHIIIKFKNNLNQEFEKLYNIKIKVKNDINLADHVVYEKSGSCYLISKND